MQESIHHPNKSGLRVPAPGLNDFIPEERHFIDRGADIQKLKHLIKRQSHQDTFMLLVEGVTGIGKTVFIKQLIFELNTQPTFSLYGKFPNVPSKIPFVALKQCIHHWLDQLLLLKDYAYESLKNNVKEAVHPNEKVLISVFEELKILLGAKKFLNDEGEVDPQRERHLLTYNFYKLLKAVHETGFKIIFFLDDLQWADFASLHLLYDLLKTYQVPGLVLVGSYRPQATDRIFTMIQKILELDKVKSYALKPLNQNELAKLLPNDIDLNPQEQKAFLEYLMQESVGIPFDALQILSFIVQEKLIYSSQDGGHQVRWNKLPHFKQDQSVSSLIRHEVLSLSLLSSKILQLASCIGYSFSCERLKLLCQLNDETFQQGLEELINKKMLITQDDNCYFVHDHFFNAAQALLSAEDKKRIHYAIARYLVKSGALYSQHPEYFDCVNHLNIAEPGDSLFTDETMAIVNMAAAMQAQKKSAFDKSLEYFKNAEQYLSNSPDEGIIHLSEIIPQYTWLLQPIQRRHIFLLCKLGIAEGEFLVQNFTSAGQTLSYIFDQAEDRMVRLKAYTLKVKIFVACLSLKEMPYGIKDVIGVVEELLREYNIYLPQTTEEFNIMMDEAYDELVELLPKENIEDLEFKEFSNDPEFHDLIHLIVHALPMIFFANIEKSKYLGLKSILLCFHKGFTPGTPSLFASIIWTIASMRHDYSLALKLGEVGLKMVEKEPYRKYRHSVYHLATLNYFNWKNHYREASGKLDEAVKIAIENGDLNFSIFCSTNARLIDIFRGVPLKKIYNEDYQNRTDLLNINFISRSHFAFLEFMSGRKPGLKQGQFRFSKSFKQQVSENINGAYHFNFVLEMLYLHAGNYKKALKAGQFCEKHKVLYEALPVGIEHDFYFCLILISCSEEQECLDDSTRNHITKRLEGIRKLASMGSGNYLHKQKILEAELAKFNPKFTEALGFYEEAIEESNKQEFLHLAALAAERCGEFLLKKNKSELARVYLFNAYQSYKNWGAQAKLEQLVQKYKYVDFLSEGPSHHTQTEMQVGQESLKWELVESAINLSQELYVSDLIKRVLHISLKQTNAKNALFLLKQQLSWQVVARLDVNGFSMSHHKLAIGTYDSPFKALHDNLKLSEISYVPNLADRHELKESGYFKNTAVDSFMVVPFERHQETLGLIYLENIEPRLIEDNNLLPWFELLRTQTGIALSNARLYENQVKLNEELRKHEEIRITSIVETQEKERKRVAAELHDHLGQMMSLTKLNLSRLEDSLNGQFKLYEDTCDLLDESCSELRRIAHNMMPPDFSLKSLQDALDNLFKRYLLAAGLDYKFYKHQLPEDIPIAVKFNIYRIAQEIIHNIIKHADAKKVTIQLTAEDNNIQMIIEDDGKGFDSGFKTDGFGLKSLYTRVSLLNGRLGIDSVINKGSVFDIIIPLP